MNNKPVILWFRNDLRLHDNEALKEALSADSDILPIYVFDDRLFYGKSSFGFRKTGVHRAKFIIESIQDLRQSLRAKGSDLIVRVGKTEEVLFQIAKELKSKWIFCNRERTQEEVEIQDQLERLLWSIGQEVRYSRGKMLYYTADLPFPVTHTPDTFTQFRKEVEKIVPIRETIKVPDNLPPIGVEIYSEEIPDLKRLGYTSQEIDLSKLKQFEGGERAALDRLNYYFFESDLVSSYKETRNGLLGPDDSSNFSPYLSQGCLSPKLIFQKLSEYENERGKNESTYHLFFELLWRDFFRLMGKKHGNAIFKRGGIKNQVRNDLNNDMSLFRIWSEGRTGMPLIDASIKELNQTGFTSNRARQNLASFLVNDLKVNWQIGAEYFESLLIDYDPCSNWGNWNYIAGVGNDPREGRYFNIVSQARKYDPEGTFVRSWLPQLQAIPNDKVHQPYLLNPQEQKDYNCLLQKDYPQICIKKEIYL